MKIRFTIHFRTDWGQRVAVAGSEDELGAWDPEKARELGYLPGDVWSGEADIPSDGNVSFEYKYILIDEKGKVTWESGENRVFTTDEEHSPWLKTVGEVDLLDSWRSPKDADALFFTSAFKKVIFARGSEALEHPPLPDKPKIKRIGNTTARFKVFAPRLRSGDWIYLAGSAPALGGWDTKKAVPMERGEYPYWSLEIESGDLDNTFDYKYIIKDKKGELVMYEDGPDRKVPGTETEPGDRSSLPVKRFVSTPNDKFRYPSPWRGAGIAIPVFSLRSEKSLGTGEFLDLKLLADWAAACGFKLLQLLPVNDTSSNMTWMDSYPYSNVSVFALHPLYLNLEAIAPLAKKMREELEERRKTLNAYDHMNYEEVMAVKRMLLKEIFAQEKDKFLSSEAFKEFREKNAFWLEPYAAFSLLRDQNGTADFTKWKKYGRVKQADIDALVSASSKDYDAVALTYFTQYHLHAQLEEASLYASRLGIVLKGDIPIGINKHSDSCWTSPELFNMDQSAGAPPDPFSDSGQNWGFPTYNWGAMANDGYKWWRERLSLMSEYFQMIRLDHVLGFFRIWEIPDTMNSGLMGHFNPAIPLWKEELEREGIWDFNRLTEPHIPWWLVKMLFGPDTDEVLKKYLESAGPRRFKLKDGFTTQAGIEERLLVPDDAPSAAKAKNERIKNALSALAANIIFFMDPHRPGYHPRMNLTDTCSFACLDEWMQEKLVTISHDYFWNRQDDFWRDEGLRKLPIIKSASDMLICGEDLGMVPHCVKPVMEELSLLGLRVQRMPHEMGREFGFPLSYEYLTVCTTSTHDMSTMRGWWGEDPARSQRFYNTVLNHPGDAPSECTPDICAEILAQHLLSPSMWAVFPIQDVLAMSKELRRPGDPQNERINDPANPHHYWKFRLHINMEKLIERKDFGASVYKLLTATGRVGEY